MLMSYGFGSFLPKPSRNQDSHIGPGGFFSTLGKKNDYVQEDSVFKPNPSKRGSLLRRDG